MGQPVIENPTEKRCFNFCPNCGAGENQIEWGSKEWMDNAAAQDAECNVCGCYFKEYYVYASTEFEVGAVPRVRCDYPFSLFYIYKDEIPEGVRVSDPDKDCPECDEEECDLRHCLIGPEGEPDPATVLMMAAMEIVGDFDEYGEVLQQDEEGEYGEDSAIEKLRRAIKFYKERL